MNVFSKGPGDRGPTLRMAAPKNWLSLGVGRIVGGSVLLILLWSSVPSVPTGHVGVLTLFGRVTKDHSRMSTTIPPTILPTPSDSQFFGAAMRSVGPRSPGPLLKTFMFASRQNFLRLAKRGDHCTWPRARGIRGSQKAASRAGL